MKAYHAKRRKNKGRTGPKLTIEEFFDLIQQIKEVMK